MVPQDPTMTSTGRAKEIVHDVRDTAQGLYEEGKERVMEWEESLESYVQERPIKSLLIAAGVGLALGFLMRRR